VLFPNALKYGHFARRIEVARRLLVLERGAATAGAFGRAGDDDHKPDYIAAAFGRTWKIYRTGPVAGRGLSRCPARFGRETMTVQGLMMLLPSAGAGQATGPAAGGKTGGANAFAGLLAVLAGAGDGGAIRAGGTTVSAPIGGPNAGRPGDDAAATDLGDPATAAAVAGNAPATAATEVLPPPAFNLDSIDENGVPAPAGGDAAAAAATDAVVAVPTPSGAGGEGPADAPAPAAAAAPDPAIAAPAPSGTVADASQAAVIAENFVAAGDAQAGRGDAAVPASDPAVADEDGSSTASVPKSSGAAAAHAAAAPAMNLANDINNKAAADTAVPVPKIAGAGRAGESAAPVPATSGSGAGPADAAAANAASRPSGDAPGPSNDTQISRPAAADAAPVPAVALAAGAEAMAGHDASHPSLPPLPAVHSGPSAHAGLLATSAMPTAQALPPGAAETLAFQIARQAADGASRFEIRLDPPELGRVDVRLDLAADGRTHAHLSAERPETLDLLVRDARLLERALNDAGVSLDRNALTFGLKDHGAAAGGSDGHHDGAMAEAADGSGERDDGNGRTRPYRTIIDVNRIDITV